MKDKPLHRVQFNMERDPRWMPVDILIFIDMRLSPSQDDITGYMSAALAEAGIAGRPVNLRLTPNMEHYWPQNPNNPCAFWEADLETVEDSSK